MNSINTPQPRHLSQLLLIFTLLISSIAVAPAGSPKAISIANPGFEAQVLATGSAEQTIEAWETERPYEGTPTVVVYLQEGKGFVGPTNAHEKANVVLIPGTQLVRQVLSETWKPNTTYNLSAYVALAFSPGSSAVIGLAHGKAPLTTAGSLEIERVVASETLPPEGQWQKLEVTITTGKSDPFLGQPIVVFAANSIFDGANNLLVDGFQLTSVPSR